MVSGYVNLPEPVVEFINKNVLDFLTSDLIGEETLYFPDAYRVFTEIRNAGKPVVYFNTLYSLDFMSSFNVTLYWSTFHEISDGGEIIIFYTNIPTVEGSSIPYSIGILKAQPSIIHFPKGQ